MARNLGLIEAARAVIDVLLLPPDQELRLRQAARQRATRNSTRIEGNTLNSEEVGRAVMAVGKSQTEMQQEVRNYWRRWSGSRNSSKAIASPRRNSSGSCTPSSWCASWGVGGLAAITDWKNARWWIPPHGAWTTHRPCRRTFPV